MSEESEREVDSSSDDRESDGDNDDDDEGDDYFGQNGIRVIEVFNIYTPIILVYNMIAHRWLCLDFLTSIRTMNRYRVHLNSNPYLSTPGPMYEWFRIDIKVKL